MAEMKGMEEVKVVLEVCLEAEQTAARVYRRFFELFRDVPEVGILWHNMAHDEERHAQFLEEKISEFERDPSVFKVTKRPLEDLLSAKKKLEGLEAEAFGQVRDVKHALEIALKIENAVTALDFLENAAHVESDSNGSHNAMMGDTMRHTTGIMRLAVKYGVK